MGQPPKKAPTIEPMPSPKRVLERPGSVRRSFSIIEEMFLWSMNKSISWKIQERSRNGKVIFIKMTVEIETYFNK